jgi:hypothetical protein
MIGIFWGRPGWAVVLALPLLTACAGQTQQPPQPVSAANAAAVAGADRQGHFGRSAGDMSTCVGFGAHTAHPELEFDLSVSPPQSVSAKKYRSDESPLWTVEFHDAGANATDVALRNVSASASDLDEIWKLVERCAAQS